LSAPEEYIKFRSSSTGLTLIKQLYDSFSSIARSNGETFGPLETLSIDRLDEESVWQELVLHNEPLIAHVEKLCRKLRECEQSCRLALEESVGGADEVSDSESEICMEVGQAEESDDILEEEDLSVSESSHAVKTRKTRPSQVDDQFFKLSDMEEYLRIEDEREEKIRNGNKATDEEEEIDLFVDIASEMESDGDKSDIEWDAVIQASSKAVGRGLVTAKTMPHKRTRELKYGDFFDPPSDGEAANLNQSEEGSDSNGSVNDDENEGIRTDSEADDLHEDDEISDQSEYESSVVLSAHEKQQAKLRQQIEQLEENNMAKKQWQLSGEVTAAQRTENSLLEEDLAFDQTARPPPVFTEETTEALEDIIKRRISDEV
jgi:U3 small nucleolar RNA-associated protein MPP10